MCGSIRTARAGLQSDLVEPTERVRRSVAKPSCGRALSSRLTPAAIRPNERRESAFRAAANAVSAATVTPRASPRAFSAAFSRSSASLSLRGLLSAMRQTHPSVSFRANSRNPRKPRTRIQPNGAALRLRSNAQFPRALNCAYACAFIPSAWSPTERPTERVRPRGTGHSTAPFACECQSFLDNVIAGLGV
jgi:hypothetical protein